MNEPENILISWSGLGREPYTFREGAAVAGSHLCLLRDSDFSGHFNRHIIFTVAAAIQDAEYISREISQLPSPPLVDIRVIELDNPTDHMQIAYGIAHELEMLDDDERILDKELYVLLNTGTPQMQTVWVLLQTLDLVNITILQTTPRHISEVDGRPMATEATIDIKSLRRMFHTISHRK